MELPPPRTVTEPPEPGGRVELPAAPPAREAFGRERPPLRRRLAAPFIALAALLGKLKAVLLLLPKIKLLTTSGTMLVSIAAYATIWSWKFALLFVALLFVHEMGHVVQLRREGIEASAPVFIPFLGAVVAAKSLGDDVAAEARVGLAGPILGSLGALACLGAYALTGEDIWRAAAYTGFFLNLFNLIPVTPFDGGRAMAALSPWMWFAGLFGMFLLVFAAPNAFIVMFALIGALDVYRRFQGFRSGAQRDYYKIRPAHRGWIALVYFGLAAALAIGMHFTHLERTF